MRVEDEPTGHLVIYYDISALKQAEKRYRDLIEQLPLVTYIDEPAVAPSIYQPTSRGAPRLLRGGVAQ